MGRALLFLDGPRTVFYPPQLASLSPVRYRFYVRFGDKNRDTDRAKKSRVEVASNTRDNAFIARISIGILPLPREKTVVSSRGDGGGRGEGKDSSTGGGGGNRTNAKKRNGNTSKFRSLYARCGTPLKTVAVEIPSS